MKRVIKVTVGRYRSEMLMCSLVATMLASPLVDRSRHIGALVAIAQILLLLAGSTYLANRRVVRLVVLPVSAIWFFARLLEDLGDGRQGYTHLAPVAGLALSCSVLRALLTRFGSVSKVTGSVISEALIGYLVIAIAFSQLYRLMEALFPSMPMFGLSPRLRISLACSISRWSFPVSSRRIAPDPTA